MTIDEAIAKEKGIAAAQMNLYDICTFKEQNQHFLKNQEYHEQLAELLEELKKYRTAVKNCEERFFTVNSNEFAKNVKEWVMEDKSNR
jgi:23S rRNA pseudoU1915 N3-methylase RlmH